MYEVTLRVGLTVSPVERANVYSAINAERDYQDEQWPESPDLSVGEHIVLLQQYVTKAINDWSSRPGDVAALDQIRKIAAIAVRAMETHGVVERGASSATK